MASNPKHLNYNVNNAKKVNIQACLWCWHHHTGELDPQRHCTVILIATLMDWKKNPQKTSTSVGCRSDSGPGACTCTCTAERTAPLRFHVVVYASGCCSFVVSLNQDATSGRQRGEKLNHPRSPMYEHKNTPSPSSSSNLVSLQFPLFSTPPLVTLRHSATLQPLQCKQTQFSFTCCSTSGWKQMLPGPFF